MALIEFDIIADLEAKVSFETQRNKDLRELLEKCATYFYQTPEQVLIWVNKADAIMSRQQVVTPFEDKRKEYPETNTEEII